MPWKASFRMTDHWHDFRPKADPSLAPRPAQARALRSRSLGMTAGRVGLRYAATLLALSILFFTGCTVGPNYAMPSAPVAPPYKKLTPENFKDTDGWKQAQPSDATLKGTWWEIFNDPQLRALKEQLNVSNQNIAAAAANFMAARALVRQTRAQYYPTISANPTITNSRPSLGQFGRVSGVSSSSSPAFKLQSFTHFSMAFYASSVPGFLGKIGNTLLSNTAAAHASAAHPQNVRRTAQ